MRPFKKKTAQDLLGDRFDELVGHADDVRRQVASHAPEFRDQVSGLAREVRDQVVERTPGVRDDMAERARGVRDDMAERARGVRDQVAERAPEVREQLRERLPEWRDEFVTRLPDSVSDRLPESAKPKKKSRLKKVAVLGLVSASAGAAYVALRSKLSGSSTPVTAPPAYTPPKAAPAPPSKPTVVTPHNAYT